MAVLPARCELNGCGSRLSYQVDDLGHMEAWCLVHGPQYGRRPPGPADLAEAARRRAPMAGYTEWPVCPECLGSAAPGVIYAHEERCSVATALRARLPRVPVDARDCPACGRVFATSHGRAGHYGHCAARDRMGAGHAV